jgi:hypothetical protein
MKLVHYMGRLGVLRSHVKAMIVAVLKVPELKQINEKISTVDAEPLQVIEIKLQHPYDMVKGLTKASTNRQNALHGFVELDLESKSNESGSFLQAERVEARVHAEIQLQDYFSRRLAQRDPRRQASQFSFFENDKYIGCSKPACYFCYLWLTSHPHGYVPPSTHGKIIAHCRGPEVDINEKGVAFLEKMYQRLNQRLTEDILRFLEAKWLGTPSIHRQFMSTDGSSRAPSVLYNERILSYIEDQSSRDYV